MAALNIVFDIPQNPTFDVEKFRNQVLDYANTLLATISSEPSAKKGHRVLDYNELTPQVRSLIGICPNTVREDDINGDLVREKAMREKYGEK